MLGQRSASSGGESLSDPLPDARCYDAKDGWVPRQGVSGARWTLGPLLLARIRAALGEGPIQKGETE